MTQRDDYDSPWKDILTAYFEQFTIFFFPDLALKIDWSRGYDSLDKELRQITREAETGGRLADKLFRVWKKNGEEAWVLAHAEVQAQKKTDFPRRTFVYNYRIYDVYERPVVSLAVLADDNPGWRPCVYSHKLWGCRMAIRFRMVKILDYGKNLKELEKSDNVFAIAVAAHLRTMETKKDARKRFHYKIGLTRELYRRGFGKSDIINLYRFIDWIMRLPEDLEKIYHQEIIKFEEERKMQYVTTAERIGEEKGIEKGIEKGALIAQILIAQRLIRQTGFSKEELKDKTVEELKNMFAELARISGESAELINI
ncbi:hypothetical protein QUF80_05185 [Desulfococcaceae bacterium HSG8]|nr:hypothetical protein [Desulfococcaceae bacterium HSG8]